MRRTFIILLMMVLSIICNCQSKICIYENEFFNTDFFHDTGIYTGKGGVMSNGDLVIQNSWNQSYGDDVVRPTLSRIDFKGTIKWSYWLPLAAANLLGLVITDQDEIIVTTDKASNTGIINEYIHIFKLDMNGNLKWSYGIKSVNIYQVIKLKDGSIVANGVTQENFPKCVLLKFTDDGKLLWIRKISNFDWTQISELNNGELVLCGNLVYSSCYNCLCISWLDKNGQIKSSKVISLGSVFKPFPAQHVKVGNENEVVIMGNLTEGGSAYDCLVKINQDYSISEFKIFSSKYYDFSIYDIEPLDDNWLLSGSVKKSENDHFNGLIMKLDDDLNILNSYQLMDTVTSAIANILSTNKKIVYYIGIRRKNPNFNVFDDNLMIIQADSSGRALCYEEPLDVLVTDYTAYTYEPAVIVEDTFNLVFEDKIVELEKEDYITGYTICETTATTDISAEAGVLRLFPNPVSSTLSIDVEQAGYGAKREQAVDITDLLGRKLYSVKVDYDGHAEVDTQTLLPGMYIAVLRADGHQVQAVKFVVVKSEK